MQQNNSKQKVVTGSAAALLVAVLITVISFYETNHRSTATASSTTSPSNASSIGSATSSSINSSTTPMSSNSSGSNMMSGNYKDGTYTATSNYYVPRGQESIQVTLTLKNGVVIDSNITNSETNYNSASYQEGFAQKYKSYVVGKNIKNVQLSYVAGASYTTNGFNDAVNSIISQAQS